MDMLKTTMKKLSLPEELRGRIQQYYNYLWHNHGSFDLRSPLFHDVSPGWQSHVDVIEIFSSVFA
eukprot:6209200-Pleurochrysis_carterae.AAC.2